MGVIKVYKDRGTDTWMWVCDAPSCLNTGWALGWGQTVRAGIAHLAIHQRGVGFGRR